LKYEVPRYVGWLWNPHYVKSKVVFDAMRSLDPSAELEEEDASDVSLEDVSLSEEQIQLSVEYLILLNCVESQLHAENSEATQFAVMEGAREREVPRATFISEYHKINHD
jgi:hypothetical protein